MTGKSANTDKKIDVSFGLTEEDSNALGAVINVTNVTNEQESAAKPAAETSKQESVQEARMTTFDRLIPSEFDAYADISTVSERWSNFVDKFTEWADITSNTNQDQLLKMFKYLMGDDARRVFKSKPEGEVKDLASLKMVLGKHYIKKRAVWTERVLFRQITRREGETLKDLALRLQSAANNCKFDSYSVDAAVAEQLIIVSNLPDLKRKVLTDTKEDYTVENVVTMGQRIEQAREECDILESGDTTKAKYVNFNSTQNNQFSRAGSPETCRRCGRRAHADAKECPAVGQTCLSCGKPNHFKVVCRSSNKIQHGNNRQSKDSSYKSNKQFNRDKHLPGKDRARGKGDVNHVKFSTREEVDAEELAEFRRYQALIKNELEIHHIGVNRIGLSEGPRATVKVNGTSLSMLVDTGSQVNLIDETTLTHLRLGQTLNECRTDIFGFKSKERIPTIGQFTAKVSTGQPLHKGTAV